MSKPKSLVILLIVWLLASGIIAAGSQGSGFVGELPLFALVGLLAFVINWLAFIPAYLKQTERFYDLTGSITYLSCISVAAAFSPQAGSLAMMIAGCVVIWAVRLGSFLFVRVHQDGGDSRFDEIKPNGFRFFNAWNIQALWVLITAGAAFAAITRAESDTINVVSIIGLMLWIFGFIYEVTADRQKRQFRQQHGRDQFINTGLWKFSQHPNYFGEITLWLGIAIMAFPALNGWAYVTLISPLFVLLLLTKVSGIPLLQAKAQKQWGDNPEWQQYHTNTPKLLPNFAIK